MNYVKLGKIELSPYQVNWSVSGKPQDYFGRGNFDYLLDPSAMQERIDEKIGKGWRMPYLKEMIYIIQIRDLDINKSEKLYIPTISNYIVNETLENKSDNRFRIFCNPQGEENNQPWIPGFFTSSAGMRNFKIQPVRDV